MSIRKSGNPIEDTLEKKRIMNTIIRPIMESNGFTNVRGDVYSNGTISFIFRGAPSKLGERKYCVGQLKSLHTKTGLPSYVVYLRERSDWRPSYRTNYQSVRKLGLREHSLGVIGGVSNFIRDFDYLLTGEIY
jgi:hypothetical protein